MAHSIYPDYPPALSPSQSHFISSAAKEWAISHGLAVGPAPSFIAAEHDPNRALATTAPITLFPSLFPLQCFHEALMIQTAYNEVYAGIARDEEWLRPVVEE